jgi:fumarate hydratase class I
LTRQFGIGAQFGGKYFCHDVRVIRLPRHGASLPGGDRRLMLGRPAVPGQDHPEGVFIEQLETDPAHYLPDATHESLGAHAGEAVGAGSTGQGAVVAIDLNRPMPEILAELSKHPVKTRLSLTGTAGRGPRHRARQDQGAARRRRGNAGNTSSDHPVYYAGPAKTPAGMPSGSFGPTTAGRMDSYVDQFQAAGGSMVMLAKGNRSQQVTDACQAHGGFYLGSIGGPAARLAQDCIKSSRSSNTPSWAWRRSGRSRSRTSPPSSSSTTRATTSSPR